MSQLSTEKPDNYSGHLTARELRLRNSIALWGPLQLNLINHREGAERGYEAGLAAYQEVTEQQGTAESFPSTAMLDLLMRTYFEHPRFRPRTWTPRIVEEWRAMFVLGWSSQVEASIARLTTREPPMSRQAPNSWQSQAANTATPASQRRREHR